MAGQSNLLIYIAALVRRFDDAAWEALANKGLLRRARKDLESGALPMSMDGSGAPDGVRIKAGAFNVFIPEAGPAKATCSCPAASVCQHILAAGLFLQRLELEPDPGTDAGPPAEPKNAAPPPAANDSEWLTLETDTIRKWTGAAEFRAAAKLVLVDNQAVEVATNDGGLLIVRFPALNAECRFTPGTGLDGVIVSGGDPRRTKRLAAAALLALRRARGIPLPDEVVAAGTAAALEESADAPRSRAEILDSVRATLQESVSVGLTHLGESTGGRLTTLSISALGVNLPRLALSLRGLADEIHLHTTRSAQADTSRCLLSMARVYALSEALVHSTRADLVGVHRSQYEDVESLELTGVCAYPWRTPSGYRGLTVLLWDERRKEWCSWSDARPEGQSAGFDPRSSYGADVGWEGGLSPQRLSRSRVRLRHARRNRAGRLSSSSRCLAAALGPTPGGAAFFGERLFINWNKLRAYSAAGSPLGLHEYQPLREIVVVQPARWLDRKFDSVGQILRWWLEDDAGDLIALELLFDTWTQQAIKNLESLTAPDRESPWQIVARVQRQAGTWSLYPLTLLRGTGSAAHQGEILHLHLDALFVLPPIVPDRPPMPLGAQCVPSEAEESEVGEPSIPDDNGDDPLLDGTSLDRTLAELEGHLEAWSERGCETVNTPQSGWFKHLSATFQTRGLSSLEHATSQIMRSGSTSKIRAAALLRCRYLCLLHRQAASSLQVQLRNINP